MASPFSPTNTPRVWPSKVPSALNVVNEKTDFAAFFTFADCALTWECHPSSKAMRVVRVRIVLDCIGCIIVLCISYLKVRVRWQEPLQ